MMPYLMLAVTIASEIFATASLKASHGFTRPIPSLFVLLGYGLSFFMLSQVLKHLSLGVAYATWSGVGTAVVALIGVLVWRESFDWIRAAGLLLVIAGVVVLNATGSGAH